MAVNADNSHSVMRSRSPRALVATAVATVLVLPVTIRAGYREMARWTEVSAEHRREALTEPLADRMRRTLGTGYGAAMALLDRAADARWLIVFLDPNDTDREAINKLIGTVFPVVTRVIRVEGVFDGIDSRGLLSSLPGPVYAVRLHPERSFTLAEEFHPLVSGPDFELLRRKEP